MFKSNTHQFGINELTDIYMTPSDAGDLVAPTIPSNIIVWGDNYQGKLGINNTVNQSSPVQLGASTWANVRLTTAFAGIRTDGTLWTSGFNGFGQLGLGNTTSISSPIQVGSLTDWKTVTGTPSVMSIKTDGTLWTWGNNSAGQLGLNDRTHRSSPVQVGALTTWKSIQSNYEGNSFMAIRTDGTLWSWGWGVGGQLGNNLTGSGVYRSSPVQVGSLTDWKRMLPNEWHYGGNYHIMEKTDGSYWFCGYNWMAFKHVSPVATMSSPIQIGSLSTWKQIACGYRHAVFIKPDGTLWASGYNSNGELGLGDVTPRSSPVQVGSGTNWKQASCGYNGTLALKTDGTLWAWGRNNRGQHGIGDTVNRSSPIQVGALTNWTKIQCGYHSVVGFKPN